MNSDRWERIQLLFEKALDQPRDKRSAFLDSACGEDVELREEVASLIAVRLRRGDSTAPDLVQGLPTQWLEVVAGQEPTSFTAGERIGGRYVIHGLLGQGGMGKVYEAWDEELAIPVALKMLMARSGEALGHLKRESLLARSVSHPNVCRVYDLSRHVVSQATMWFLTMELLRGETLEHRLRKNGRIPIDRALLYAEQMVAGLGAAHQAGVVHRDFKPGNVMLVEQGNDEQAIVMDFGLARGGAQSAPRDDEEVSSLFGTPAYMAPEQILGETIGQPADIYALGIVFFEMITGKLPFTGNSGFEVAMRRLEEDPPSPRRLVPELDERWENVILRCLEREPGRRFGRAEEVLKALTGKEEVDDGRDVAAFPECTLPADRDLFVGRESDLQALEHQLAGQARLVTLLGAAGMGKTRLAVRYGWRSLGQWPGGVWFCDLADAKSLSGIVSAVATSLGIQLGREDPVSQLGNAIAGRGRCLMILDNVEQVVEAAASAVGQWMPSASEARFVVTSRERLSLEDEEVLRLEPLSQEQGMALFESRARWLRPGLKLEGNEAGAAQEVVRLLDGIPLAIELAAGRMRMMSATQLVARMRQRFQLLTGGPGTRHETLAAAIEGSWEQLRDWERVAWTQCSVFEGGFTFEAAEAVIDLELWPEKPGAVDVIQSLVDRSLLRTWVVKTGSDQGMAQMRLGMYVGLQEFARLKLRGDREMAAGPSGVDEEHTIEERHGNWYRRYGTEEALDALDTKDGVSRRWQLEQELENLTAACRRAVARGDEATVVETYRATWAVLGLRGPFAAALDLGHHVLTNLGLNPDARANTLATLGQAELRCGHTDEAARHFETALAICREQGLRRLEGEVLGHLGALYVQKGQVREAIHYYEMARAKAQDAGAQHLEGHILANLGATQASWGRFEEAETALEAALAIHREMGDRRFEGIVLGNLSMLRTNQGRMKEAVAYNETALQIHREVGHRRMEGVTLVSLAGLHYHHGRMAPARSCYEAAIRSAREMGDKDLEGMATGSLGIVHLACNDLANARKLFETALLIHRKVNNRRFEASVLRSLGDLNLREGRIAEARSALAQSEAISRQVEDRIELSNVLCSLAELQLECLDLVAARKSLAEAQALADLGGSGPDSDLGRRVVELHEKLGAG